MKPVIKDYKDLWIFGVLGLLALLSIALAVFIYKPINKNEPEVKCWKASSLVYGEGIHTYNQGDTELCGQNLEFHAIIGPSYQQIIDSRDAEILNLKKCIINLKSGLKCEE